MSSAELSIWTVFGVFRCSMNSGSTVRKPENKKNSVYKQQTVKFLKINVVDADAVLDGRASLALFSTQKCVFRACAFDVAAEMNRIR